MMCHFYTCFGALAEFPRIFLKTQGFTLKNENAFVNNGCLVRVGFPLSLQSCSTAFRGKYFFSRVSPTSIYTYVFFANKNELKYHVELVQDMTIYFEKGIRLKNQIFSIYTVVTNSFDKC